MVATYPLYSIQETFSGVHKGKEEINEEKIYIYNNIILYEHYIYTL